MVGRLWKYRSLIISIHDHVVDDNNTAFKNDLARKNNVDTMVVRPKEIIDESILYQVKRIMNDNFFHQLKSCDGSDITELINKMKTGKDSSDKGYEILMVNGEKCHVFYTPIRYTKWLLVYVVPCHDTDIMVYLNSIPLLLILILIIVLIVLVVHHFIKEGLEPMKQLIQVTDNIAKGNFNTPVPGLKYPDEMSQLCDSIEEMKYSLSNYADDKKRAKPSSE